MWEMSKSIWIKLHHLKYIWTMYDVQLVNHKQIQHAYFLLFPLKSTLLSFSQPKLTSNNILSLSLLDTSAH